MERRQSRPFSVTNIPGGYRLECVRQICSVWVAYRTRAISLLALRTYMALLEVAERRHAAALRGRVTKAATMTLSIESVASELHALVKCARRSQVIAALRQLQTVGVLDTNGSGITLHAGSQRIPGILRSETELMWNRFGRRKFVPFPRRALRALAATRSAAVIATMLASCLRCVYQRVNGVSVEGSCSIRLIAVAFGLHPRTVKTARRALRAAGWLCPIDADHWHIQKHGARLRFDAAKPCCRSESPPPRRRIGTNTPPPRHNKKLLTDPRNQEPLVVREPSERGTTKCVFGLRDIQLIELQDAKCLDLRYREAIRLRLISESPAERLRFFAAAAHASRVATRNTAGLFAAVIRRGLWSYISQADEDQARRMLLAYDRQNRVRGTSASSEQVRQLVSGLAARVAWPASQHATIPRSMAAMLSKSRAGSSSPASASSSRMASREPSTMATFSTNARRKAAGSVNPSVHAECSSMPRISHKHRSHGKWPKRRLNGSHASGIANCSVEDGALAARESQGT